MKERGRNELEGLNEQVVRVLNDPSKPWNLMMDMRGSMHVTAALEQVRGVEPDLAVLLAEHTNYGREGGIGRYKQVYVIFNNKFKRGDSYEYRNRYRPELDRPENAHLMIDNAVVNRSGETVVVTVTLINKKTGQQRKFTCDFEQT